MAKSQGNQFRSLGALWTWLTHREWGVPKLIAMIVLEAEGRKDDFKLSLLLDAGIWPRGHAAGRGGCCSCCSCCCCCVVFSLFFFLLFFCVWVGGCLLFVVCCLAVSCWLSVFGVFVSSSFLFLLLSVLLFFLVFLFLVLYDVPSFLLPLFLSLLFLLLLLFPWWCRVAGSHCI